MRESGIFFVGLMAGILLASACGWDLFASRTASEEIPSRGTIAASAVLPPQLAKLEDDLLAARRERESLSLELDEARAELSSLRTGGQGGGESGGENGGPAGERGRIARASYRGGAGAAGGLSTPPHPESEGSAADAGKVSGAGSVPGEGAGTGAGEREAIRRGIGGVLQRSLETSSWVEASEALELLLEDRSEGASLIIEAVRGALRAGALAREPAAPYPIIRAALRHPEGSAELIASALEGEAAADPELSILLFRLAPPFLAADPAAFPEARAALAQRLLASLEKEPPRPGLWWILEGLRALGVSPGVAALGRILADPSERDLHGTVILHLARQGTPEAVAAIDASISAAADPWSPAVAVAIRELGRLDLEEARAALLSRLGPGDRQVRELAAIAYFSRERKLEDAPLAARLLDGDSSPAAKRKLLQSLRNESPAILRALKDASPGVSTGEARALLGNEARPVESAEKSGTDRTAGGGKPGGPSPAPLAPRRAR